MLISGQNKASLEMITIIMKIVSVKFKIAGPKSQLKRRRLFQGFKDELVIYLLDLFVENAGISLYFLVWRVNQFFECHAHPISL